MGRLVDRWTPALMFEPTPQQRRAIEAPLGPVLVIAGPGAGKTFCLIYRIQHLIQELHIPPRRILAVTFTNKAAEEIATRLHDTRGVAAADITRGTLHAICLMILRDFAERCGLRPGFGVADREYQEQVLRRLRIPSKAMCPGIGAFQSLSPSRQATWVNGAGLLRAVPGGAPGSESGRLR